MHVRVKKNELRQLGMEVGRIGLDRGDAATGWLWIGVRHERGLGQSLVAWPEAGRRELLSRAQRYPAHRPLRWRGWPPGVARGRQV